jgi:roadblock/LC7 domain-containing protein
MNGTGRCTVAEAASLGGVRAVLEVEDDRVVAAEGLDSDTTEVVAHFAETWTKLGDALLPAMDETLGEAWVPGRWWAYAGGGGVALQRDGRCVLVDAKVSGPFLAALDGDGVVDGIRVW